MDKIPPPAANDLRDGHDITDMLLDATSAWRADAARAAAEADLEQRRRRTVAEFERTGAKLSRPKGYRRGGKRRKSELRKIGELFGPTLVERREAARAARNAASR